jgi:serine/threonine protein phosphatase PrpC
MQSKDHSVPYMLYLSKEIKESEIRNHPDRNMLLRVMGSEWKGSMYEVFKPLNLKHFQAFLLCSDGFWELITEDEMCELLKKTSTAAEWLDAMTKVVQKNGIGKEMDNYSAIAILNK